MKKLILAVICFLSLCTPTHGWLVAPQVVDVVAAGAYVTDNFDSYSAGALGGQGNWLTVTGAMTVVKPAADGEITPASVGAHSACRYNSTFASNQYAAITLSTISSTLVGVSVRCQSGAVTYYYAIYNETIGRVYYGYNNAGTPTDINNLNINLDTGHKLRLEASGTSPNVKITVKTDVGAGWVTQVDAVDTVVDIAGGQPGLAGYDSGGTTVDDWAAGDL